MEYRIVTTRYAYRRTVVIPAAIQATANSMALQLDPEGGAETFTVPLSPTGSEPATHYWCSTSAVATAAQAIDQMQAGLTAQGYDVRVYDETWTPEEILATLGLRRIGAQGVGV